MKIASYRTDAGPLALGRVDVEQQTILPLRVPDGSTFLDLLASGRSGAWTPETSAPLPLSRVGLSAPIAHPRRNIFCVGKNYRQHAAEFARSGFDSSAAQGDVPKDPIIFSKVPESVIGPGETIVIDPRVSSAIDYEAELAVVIGLGGRRIPKVEAMHHVCGYTIVNDVTSRDLQ